MTDLSPDHVIEVCNYLIQEAETAASDHRALASRYQGGSKRTMLKAADDWDARAAWIREAQAAMSKQLEAV